jgi:hypothetical protein
MLGGAAPNPDSAILRQKCVSGPAIRFYGRIEAASLVDLSELLLKFRDPIRDAP